MKLKSAVSMMVLLGACTSPAAIGPAPEPATAVTTTIAAPAVTTTIATPAVTTTEVPVVMDENAVAQAFLDAIDAKDAAKASELAPSASADLIDTIIVDAPYGSMQCEDVEGVLDCFVQKGETAVWGWRVDASLGQVYDVQNVGGG